MAHKKAPSTLIDDCIEKFSLHERQRLKLLSEQRSTDSSSELTLGEGDLPTSPTDSPFEELDGTNASTGMFTVGSQTNLVSLAGTRGSFPERILEDSGFDEQQEFRSRCSSVTAIMQRRVHDTNLKIQPRRRHASAPSHVQPSDSEKNRTMLFQVCPCNFVYKAEVVELTYTMYFICILNFFVDNFYKPSNTDITFCIAEYETTLGSSLKQA